MKKPTWAEEVKKIKDDLDLQRQGFIPDQQLMAWYNDAIDLCEPYIHDLSEDWFLSDKAIELVKDQREYKLPTDIYAGAIRRLNYDNGVREYDLCRIRSLSDQPSKSETCLVDFSYLVFNNGDDDSKIRLFPTPNKSDSTSLKIEYIRNAKRLEFDIPTQQRLGQQIDIPEFSSYCRWYVLCRCYIKEKQWNDYNVAKAERDELRAQMIKTLSRKEKDGQTELIPDFNSYTTY